MWFSVAIPLIESQILHSVTLKTDIFNRTVDSGQSFSNETLNTAMTVCSIQQCLTGARLSKRVGTTLRM
jgi:hypothetical protein